MPSIKEITQALTTLNKISKVLNKNPAFWDTMWTIIKQAEKIYDGTDEKSSHFEIDDAHDFSLAVIGL